MLLERISVACSSEQMLTTGEMDLLGGRKPESNYVVVIDIGPEEDDLDTIPQTEGSKLSNWSFPRHQN